MLNSFMQSKPKQTKTHTKKTPHKNGNPAKQKIMGTKHLAQVSAIQ